MWILIYKIHKKSVNVWEGILGNFVALIFIEVNLTENKYLNLLQEYVDHMIAEFLEKADMLHPHILIFGWESFWTKVSSTYGGTAESVQ